MTPGMVLETPRVAAPVVAFWHRVEEWAAKWWGMAGHSEAKAAVNARQPEGPGAGARASLGRPETAVAEGLERPRHVLVVEDNAINQKILAVMLRKRGFEVEVAGDGAEALRKLAVGRYGLVLMDLQMPQVDGYEATRRIRANPLTADVPVVAVTAYAMNGEKEKCLAAGMNGYLAKPVDQAELLAAVERFVPQEG